MSGPAEVGRRRAVLESWSYRLQDCKELVRVADASGGLSRPDNGSAALDVAAGDWQEAIDCRSVNRAATPFSSPW